MIVQEHFDVEGRDFIRTYSDSGRYVVRDGVEYSEACDPAEFCRIYSEGEYMSEDEREVELAAKAEAYDILMGGAP